MDRALIAQFEELLCARIGLNPGSLGSATLERILKRATRERSISTSEYLQRCLESSEECTELVKRIVVPESWFFRDRKLFTELARIALHHREQNAAPIRILSAPCAHGEEPYSAAVALLSAGFSTTELSIVGLDISEDVLEQARSGVYGARAFRSALLPHEIPFFTILRNHFQVSDRLRDVVTFQQHNLVEPIPAALGTFDIILCRNVLIYLTPEIQQQLLSNLCSVLNPNGALILTPAESSLLKDPRMALRIGTRSDIFVSRNHPDAVRPVRRAATSRAPKSAAGTRERPVREAKQKPTMPPVQPRPVMAVVPSVREQAVIAAQQGESARAVELFAQHLRNSPLDSEALLLQAVLFDALGDSSRAREQYRRVLYLAPNNFDALCHLAVLERRNGNIQIADRLIERAKKAGDATQASTAINTEVSYEGES